jgi:hypothetical protein
LLNIFSIPLYIKSAPSSTLEAKKKKTSAHDKNLNYLPKPYGHFIKGVALDSI